MAGLMSVLAVAVVARLSYELLAPLLPLLIIFCVLAVLYAIIFGRFRR